MVAFGKLGESIGRLVSCFGEQGPGRGVIFMLTVYLLDHLPLPGGKRGLIGRTGRAPENKYIAVFGEYKSSNGH